MSYAPDTIERWQHKIEADKSLQDKYEDLMNAYWRYLKRSGRQCPFCRAIAKQIMSQETYGQKKK